MTTTTPEPFRLVSTWLLRAPAPVVWRLLADPGFTWPGWWPLLRTVDTHPRTDADGRAAPGASVTLRVRSPAGRALQVRLALDAVTPPGDVDGVGHARFTADGDLAGTALVVVRPVPGGCVVALRWDVTPAADHPGLAAHRHLSTLAHAAVMRAGEAGLRRHLRRTTAPTGRHQR
ncbi:hypothetical protein ATJ88_2376 [Isoptericola jiangsuensis]|uniref:Polyketide cyclase/dehydrase/lipid transport protein n=1 Tax=Isoptericola jiangsuensis TaxID=548579 RepID=A0A2A9EZH7_9MICO|nr:hypothetical protein [Isoptericola jiangsuensis]PFG43670.1 hypothetical protein ATJ88_2376 [Isoptericola jiangsuensis]